MKTFEFKKYGKKYSMRLQLLTYPNQNLAIQMLHYEEGEWETWNVLTVNLGNTLPMNCAYIDTNNNGKEILPWIVRHGLAVPTGRTATSGFCSYPEYRFRPEILKEADPEGYITYLNTQKARQNT